MIRIPHSRESEGVRVGVGLQVPGPCGGLHVHGADGDDGKDLEVEVPGEVRRDVGQQVPGPCGGLRARDAAVEAVDRDVREPGWQDQLDDLIAQVRPAASVQKLSDMILEIRSVVGSGLTVARELAGDWWETVTEGFGWERDVRERDLAALRSLVGGGEGGGGVAVFNHS